MARAPSPFVEHCLDLFAPLGPVVHRCMFGGWGFWLRGDFFALISDEQLFLKADQETAADFAAQGSEPFVYRGQRGREVTMSYYSAPTEALESADQMFPWALKAIDAAHRNHRQTPRTARQVKRTPHAGKVRRAARRTPRRGAPQRRR